MHLVQYPEWYASWLIEGLAEIVREALGINNARANWTLRDEGSAFYNSGYGVAALFIQDVEQSHGIDLVDPLMAEIVGGRYGEQSWLSLAGRSLHELWNESRPSRPLPTAGVTLFADAHYGRPAEAVLVGPGAYELAQLEARQLRNDSLSSLWVPTGFEAELFRDDGFVGSLGVFTRNVASLRGLDADDRTSSIVVRRTR